MKKFLQNFTIVIVSILFAYCLVEIYARIQVYERYINAKSPMVASNQFVNTQLTVVDNVKTLAWSKPHCDFHYWRIDENANIIFKTDYHSNNIGLVSRRDQPIIRTNKEFRIVVIGDSFTAAIEMPIPWTDILEDVLNENSALRDKLDGARFSVYNFGYPSGGFLDFKRMAENAKALEPDLVVVNYIEADFHRCNNCFEEDVSTNALPPLELVSGQIVFPLEGESETAKVSVTCERPPVSFDNPTCRHSFALDAPPSIVENPEKLKALKQRILKEFIRGQLWTSPYPYAFRLAMGRPVSLNELQNADKYIQKPRKVKELTDDEKIDQAASFLHYLQQTKVKTIVTRHPTYEDLIGKGTFNLTEHLVTKYKDISVIDMRKFLPENLNQNEYYSWFCLPNDGHMGQSGGQQYAAAMAKVIKATLVSP